MEEQPSSWDSWTEEALKREFLNRLARFYGQLDGSIQLPNSLEGDMLKLAAKIASKNR